MLLVTSCESFSHGGHGGRGGLVRAAEPEDGAWPSEVAGRVIPTPQAKASPSRAEGHGAGGGGSERGQIEKAFESGEV